jgi:hypothetical protein
MTEGERLSAVATHLYVRLRRDGGRVIDVLWLLRNQDYAREVVRLAREIPDAEVERLADRFEELMFGIVKAPRQTSSSPVAAPTQAEQPPAQVETRYRGALR